ncbi:hypothetical protein [Herbaspirillum sp. ST 5-3]|uniref:hypothetical protein n=1 Tax=Oxalobacteraceae TaxID=75682 RepID=UPI0010A51D90|nr:hypothetical protein [Herbaspirillum sp. ST 5-3]
MGTWGSGIYDDDFAADLRNSVAIVCKVPSGGDRLTEILLQLHGITSESEDETTFWLVLADQFERRGIECPGVFTTALSIIESGADLSRLKDQDADERFLKKRAVVLEALATRLRAPRPFRPRSMPRKPPDLVLEVGSVFAFPTMNGFACSPWRLPRDGPFATNGWGAFVVLDCGRAFDWLPWCALASLTVEPSRKPTIDDAIHANLIFHLQTDGAARCVPKRSDAKTMQLELIGRIALDPNCVKPHLSKWSINDAIECGWSIANAGYSTSVQGLPRGPQLLSLMARNVG